MYAFNNSAVQLLRHYAMVEALVTAVRQEKEASKAFAIGASSYIPGVGQMINNDSLQGSLLLFSASIAGVNAKKLQYTVNRTVKEPELLIPYYAVKGINNMILWYSLLHAANSKYIKTHDHTAAIWTGMASHLPGLGQAINGDWWEAGGFLLASALCSLIELSLEDKVYLSSDEASVVAKNKSNITWDFACLPNFVYLNCNIDF